jgi:hypothetical protein
MDRERLPVSEEHKKNIRPSSRGKHQKGQRRKKKDQGGEKGDQRRPYKKK